MTVSKGEWATSEQGRASYVGANSSRRVSCKKLPSFWPSFACFPGGVRVTRRSAAVLVLASGSEGRLRLLREAGIYPEAVVSGVDETAGENLDTAALVQELADRKAAAVAARRPAALVLGCDSLLDLDGVALGKPESADQAVSMWRRPAGRQGTLLTGHCLIDGASGPRVRRLARTLVRFGLPTATQPAAS